MSTEITPTSENDRRRKLARSGLQLPAVIEAAGGRARSKFVEFFIARLANDNTRKAYGRAVTQFFRWCADREIQLEDISPNIASVYIHTRETSDATVKQHLAALRGLYDWLVTEQVVPENPFSSCSRA